MRYNYIATFFAAFTLAGLTLLTAQDLHAQSEKPMVGEALLTFTLQLPEQLTEKVEQQKYLGIGSGPFHISDIKADVVMVEIFSMYCPHCQKDAPNMNNFFTLLRKNGQYKERIRLIGIGVGNSEFEVDFFRKTYNIEFPLFSDPDFTAYNLIGGVRTPYFIGFKKMKDGSYKVFMSEAGGERKPETFIDQIVKQSGLNQN